MNYEYGSWVGLAIARIIVDQPSACGLIVKSAELINQSIVGMIELVFTSKISL
ncbi:hypothetical protein Pse7367_0802 [Thalassoporum mexicanum PCC 7367]|nr:hypothetical protein Pse7367_0802 [Pseudanabaena sp. PCC 7367]